jgi:PST family polysaccharide transporter
MSIRHSAVKGASYASAAVLAGRSMTFVSQLVIGWVLVKEDFAIYALAVGVMGFTNALIHGGANILMLQGSDRIDRVLPAGMRLAVIFDIGIPLIIAALAWPIAKAYDSSELAPILWIIAGSFPLCLLGLPYRMRAAAMGRFGDVSFANFTQSFTQQVLIITFALCGFGAFAFVLGQPIVNVLDWLILRKRIGPADEISDNPDSLKSLIKPAALVLVSALGIALAVGTAENLILGVFASPLVLAYYFFAYRLTAAINQVFSSSIRSVLLPSFAKLKQEPERMQAAGVKAYQTCFFFTIPLFYMLAFIIGPIMHFLWQGKWDESAIVAFALILAQPTRLGLFISRSLLEAGSQWTTAAVLVWVDGILLALVVIFIAPTNDLTTIAFAIAAYRGLGGLVLSLISLKLAGISMGRILPLLRVPIIASLAIVPAWYFSGGHPEANTSMVDSIVSSGIFVACYAVLGLCFLRSQFSQAISAVSLRRNR